MKIVEQGYKSVVNLNAKVLEDVSNNSKVEFRRKIRISTGNFQNFFLFIKILLKPFNSKGFVLFSHKVLRWFGAFFLIFAFISSIILSIHNIFYFSLSILAFACILLPLVDIIFKKFDIHLFFARHLTYFFLSNIAAIIGFFKYLKGVKSSIWSPTQRYQ
jgi:hypothetical protein